MWQVPIIPATWRLKQENCLNPGGGGCGELRWRHCIPAWVTRVKLRLKKKKEKKSQMLKYFSRKDTHTANRYIEKILGQVPWLLPVILGFWQAEVGGSQGLEFKTSLINMVKPCLY